MRFLPNFRCIWHSTGYVLPIVKTTSEYALSCTEYAQNATECYRIQSECYPECLYAEPYTLSAAALISLVFSPTCP